MRTIATVVLGAWLAMLSTATAVPAAELDPAHVPADAKLVIHVDLDALSDTTLANRIRQEHTAKLAAARAWMMAATGIDLHNDLHGMTIFTDTYEPDCGSMVLLADFDQERVVSLIERHGDAETESWRGHTLYTMSKKGHDDETFVLVLLEGEKAVFASSPERAKATVKLLLGEAASLADSESDLIVDSPAGTVLYAAAKDLDEISCRDLPIIQQHRRIVWLAGEHEGEVFEDVLLEGDSEQVARRMRRLLRGMVAFVELWAGDSEEILQLARDTEIERNGSVVEAHYRGSTEDLIAALEVIKERMPECCRHHHRHHGHWGHRHRDRDDCDCEKSDCDSCTARECECDSCPSSECSSSECPSAECDADCEKSTCDDCTSGECECETCPSSECSSAECDGDCDNCECEDSACPVGGDAEPAPDSCPASGESASESTD